MNTDKAENEDLTIWGAVGPNGQLVKSSVGTFKSVAARWALRRGNYEVVKLGTIPSPGKTVDEEKKEEKAPKKVAAREKMRRGQRESLRAIPSHRRRYEVNDSDMEFTAADTPSESPEEKTDVTEKLTIDRNFFGRRRKRRK